MENDNQPIDDEWMKEIEWVQIGNTWYPPESSHPHAYDRPLMFWCRVDGAIQIAGSVWVSRNDATRGELRELCRVLGVKL